MDAQVANRMWRDILPECVRVSAGPLLEIAAPLTVHERESAGAVDSVRMRELVNGRSYSKRALAELGLYDVELPVAANRSPQWPDGVTGSIAHARGAAGAHIAAAVARTRDVRAVGIDVDFEGGLPPRAWSHVLTTHELDRIRTLPPDERATEVPLIWCAKEAAAKAAGRPFEPTDLEIERDPVGNGFTAIWRSVSECPESAEKVWRGRLTRTQGFILAAVVLLRGARHAARRPHQ